MGVELDCFLEDLAKLRHCTRESLFKRSGCYALLNWIAIVNDRLFRNEAETAWILLSNHLQNSYHLIRITNNISFAISILLHLRTWRKRKTWTSRKQESLFKWFFCCVIWVFLSKENKFSQNASKTPLVHLLVVFLFIQYNLWSSIPSWTNVWW